MDLNISKEISFPLKAVTETFAAIGRRGAGKSYLATMMAEQMLDARAQVVAIDPVGIWWGLRVAADGKSKGKSIFVIGGEHGDVPIVPDAGKRIAQLIIDKGVSAVIDVSSFRIGEHKRFSADFAEEFFHLKKVHKSPIHLFLEEAQTLIPQRVGPDEARMVGAFERIVRLGRNYGIGCTLITQRPQSVNKEVLSQVECLCVLQVTGLHERKALEGWVQEKDADRKLIGELPSLGRGEGYVWSPAFLRIYKRVHFAKKVTFDASATPEVGKETKAAHLSAVDVEKLREDMADVIAKAEADNPAALQRRIRELEKVRPQSDPKTVEKAVASALAQRDREWEAERKLLIAAINARDAKIRTAAGLLGAELSPVPDIIPNPAIAPTRQSVVRPAAVPTTPRNTTLGESGISNPEQRVLNGVAWMENIGITEPVEEIVAFLSGYAHINSKGFTSPCGSLRARGLISYPAPGRIALTDEGRMLAQFPVSVGTTEELHRIVLDRLDNPKQRLLRPLLAAYPADMSAEDLCKAAGYMHPNSKGFTNPRGTLRSFGLIDYPSPGRIRASDILFL
jgi:hypothetical protein